MPHRPPRGSATVTPYSRYGPIVSLSRTSGLGAWGLGLGAWGLGLCPVQPASRPASTARLHVYSSLGFGCRQTFFRTFCKKPACTALTRPLPARQTPPDTTCCACDYRPYILLYRRLPERLGSHPSYSQESGRLRGRPLGMASLRASRGSAGASPSRCLASARTCSSSRRQP